MSTKKIFQEPKIYTVGVSVTWDSEHMGLQPHKGHSGCSNSHDIQVWSNTHHILPIEAKETFKYGHRKLMKTNF